MNIYYILSSQSWMEKRKVDDPMTARFIRKKHKGDGQDE